MTRFPVKINSRIQIHVPAVGLKNLHSNRTAYRDNFILLLDRRTVNNSFGRLFQIHVDVFVKVVLSANGEGKRRISLQFHYRRPNTLPAKDVLHHSTLIQGLLGRRTKVRADIINNGVIFI